MADFIREMSAEIDRIQNQMRNTDDPAMLESLRKDMESLRNEYMSEMGVE